MRSFPHAALWTSTLWAGVLWTSSAFATDVDAWSPGPASGNLSDPLSGLSAQAPQPGSTLVGTWFSAASQPLWGLSSSTADGTWSPALSTLGTAGLWTDWHPSTRAPLTIGGRARFRAIVVPTYAVDSLSSSAGLSDATAWVRLHSRTTGAIDWSASLDGSVDPDTLTDAPPAGDLGWLTGAGNAVGSSIAVRQTLADTLISSASVRFSHDLRSRDALPELVQYPPHQMADLRLGVALPRTRVAWLTEVHARGARTPVPDGATTWSQSVELRAGARLKLGRRWQGTTMVGFGVPFYDRGARVQPNGAPRTRLGIDLRRVGGPEDTTLEQPIAPGELVVAPVDRSGTPLRGIATPGHPHRIGPGGEHIIRPAPGSRVAVEAAGTIRLTATPPVHGQLWQPTLPLRGGDGRLDIVVEDTAARPAVVHRLTVADVAIPPPLLAQPVTLEGLAVGPVQVAAEGPLTEPTTGVLTASDDTELDRLVVNRPAGATRVEVRADGRPVPNAPLAAFDGLEAQSATTDSDGFGFFVLPEGLWKVRVEMEGKGSQEQTVVVTNDPHHLQQVPFSLLAPATEASTNLDVRIQDPEGAPVDQARVVLGDTTVGETASGGHLRIEQMPVTDNRISIQGDRLEATQPLQVPWLDGGDTYLQFPVNWQPGVASIRVRDFYGNVIPGTRVRFLMVAGKPGKPIELGPSGLYETTLEPGAYEVVVSAPDHGIQLYDLVVPSDPGERVVLDIQLQPAGGMGTQLTLRILDESNAPIDKTNISIDGQLLAAPARNGQWSIEDVPIGTHSVEVVSAHHQVWSGTIELAPKQHLEQTVVLGSSFGILDVRADYEQVPLPATVRMIGPENRPTVYLGADGAHRFHLEKGPWEAVFAAPGFGIDLLETTVLEDDAVALSWSPELVAPDYATVALPPRPVTVRVLDRATGAPVAATIRALGADVVAPVQSTVETPATLKLEPGTWEFLAEVEGRGVTGGRFLVSAVQKSVSVDLVIGSQKVTVGNGEVRLDDRILFAVGEATIETVSHPLLDELARTLLVHPELRRVAVEGHTDDSGSAESNLLLSRQRAQAVRRALIERGVSPRRLVVEAYGASRPIGDNSTAAGRELNRRVVVRIVEQTTTE